LKISAKADLIVLDEGHRIKSSASKIAQALALVQTKRRIILTAPFFCQSIAL
jgi:SNF2 family DNA or RNA helicase